jgi:RNA polymerase sigma-70 factor (ECF subfamily)
LEEIKKYPHLDLINRCKNNDRQSQHKIYELYAKPMFNVCYRIINQHEEAEDVLQESFIKMYKQINSYREDSTFGAWFKRIVVNNSLNHLKKRERELIQIENIAYEADKEYVENDTEDIPKATIVEIQNAMELLPEGYRIVFTLFLFEGYSHKEIADRLGISESTSKSQLNRSKKKMKEILINKAYEKN